MKETRNGLIIEVRASNDSHEADIRIVSYDKVDSYKTTFAPGSFSRAVEEGSISSVFSHDPSRPIGVVTNLRDSSEALEGTLEFLDFESCPDARLVYEAMKKKAIRGVSFGFERIKDMPHPKERGVTCITEIDVFEASPVLRNSVPGSRVLAVRSDETISRSAAADLIVRFSTGDIDLADALVALKNGTGEGAPPLDPSDIPPPEEDPKPASDPEEVPQPDEDEDEILSRLDFLSRNHN